MQYILIAILAVAAVVLYLWLCVLVLLWVGVPMMAVLGPLSFAGGLILAWLRVAQVLTGRRKQTRILAPDDFAAKAARRRGHRPHLPIDVAWPSYFAGQVYHDQVAAARWLIGDCVTMWRQAYRAVAGDRLAVAGFFWPVVLPVVVALAAVTAGVAAGYLAAAAVVAAATVVAWSIGLVLAGTLRGVDLVWQRVFQAAASCPSCYAVTGLPAYRCAGSHPAGVNLHRVLRPGRLGVLRRRCSCGILLPTTVLRAAYRLKAVCQMCGQPLHDAAGVAADVRVPVFGAAASGKTHLIMGGLVALLRHNGTQGVEVKMADSVSEKTYSQYRDWTEQGLSPPKTDAGRKPMAVTVQLKRPPRTTLVHVFDAAGEALVDPGLNAELGYLDLARTLVFVLDPFSIPDVRGELRLPSFRSLEAKANAAVTDPEESYNGTVNRLRAYGVKTETRQLALVLSKADLLSQLPIKGNLRSGRSDSEAVRQWLVDRRLDNLTAVVERDFARVRYFFLSAKDVSREGALAPFAWLLQSERFALQV